MKLKVLATSLLNMATWIVHKVDAAKIVDTVVLVNTEIRRKDTNSNEKLLLINITLTQLLCTYNK